MREIETAVIEGMIRIKATKKGPIRRALLALLVLGGAVLLALSSEPARAATTFTVNTNADGADAQITNARCDADATATGNQCTLRAAIEESNDTAGVDTIAFGLGTTAAEQVISPASPLPAITDAVTIDGYTQQGSSPNTLAEGNDADIRVTLDGLNAGVAATGLTIENADCTVKGLVIRRFDYGIQILGAGATGNRIEGTFIGVNRDGITARGNDGGVFIESDSNTIGGTQPASRNVISGNDGIGIFIGSAATNNKIEGNYIGTTADGSADLGNDFYGAYIAGHSNTLGGTAAGARNVISGNDFYGVFISGINGGDENRIEGNYIGTGAHGTGNLGNTLDGVTIQNEAELNAVGGTASRAGNRIAHNGADGVSIATASVGNHVLSNSIFNNDGLGIDLLGGTEDANGVTANDTNDPDAGANKLQNFPVIRSATKSSATARTTTISGKLNSDPSQDFVVQCFLTNGAPASAHGEGLRLLDTALASTNANGNTSFTCDGSLPLLGQRPRQTVSATATNIVTGDTSEFSRNKAITIGP